MNEKQREENFYNSVPDHFSGYHIHTIPEPPRMGYQLNSGK